ncbi:MAG: DUF799 family lipoprotein [Anaeromyxobacter sp.]
MKTLQRALAASALLLVAVGCAPVQKTGDYTTFLSAQPRSILIPPVLNKTNAVEAPDYFLSTIPVPVAERGYYVFPVNMVKRVLEDDGLADAGLVHQAPVDRLASLFGADAVLYVTIEEWTAQYVLINTNVVVKFSYVLKDAKTGQEIWAARQTLNYSSSQNSGNSGGGLLGSLIASAVSAAIAKAAPNYMPLAHQANAQALTYPGAGFPSGPYHPQFHKDVDAGQLAAATQGAATPAPAPAPAAPPTDAPAAQPAAAPAPAEGAAP